MVGRQRHVWICCVTGVAGTEQQAHVSRYTYVVGAQLQQDVHVDLVLKKRLELDNLVMAQLPVNLDLSHELCLGARLHQGGLGDDFARQRALLVHGCERVALGEATLVQQSRGNRRTLELEHGHPTCR